MTQHKTTYPDEPSWQQGRNLTLGSSDSRVLWNQGYANQSLFSLWEQKVNGVPAVFDDATKVLLRRGHQMEPTILGMFEEETGIETHSPTRTIFVLGILGATLDAITATGEPVEAKNVSQWQAHEWDDGVPLMHEIQSQHQQAVLEVGFGWVVALIGGCDLRVHRVERNDGFIKRHQQAAEEFWELVQSKTPPVVDGSEATRQALTRYYPRDKGTEILLPEEAREWDIQLAALKEDRDAADVSIMELENKIKAAIGDNTRGLLPGGGSYSWKTQERKGYTVQPGQCRVLRRHK